MRRICCVFLLTAASGLAQKAANDEQIERLKKLAQQLKREETSKQAPSGACAIPLLKAEPSKGGDPKIKQVVPDTGKAAPMPQYKGLPSCDAKPW